MMKSNHFQWKRNSLSLSPWKSQSLRLISGFTGFYYSDVMCVFLHWLSCTTPGERLTSLKSKIQSTCCKYITVLPGCHHCT